PPPPLPTPFPYTTLFRSITTRQDLQFHFVHKGHLHALISTLNRHLVSTLAACGDVVRNVMCCPASVPGRDQATVLAAARALSARDRKSTRLNSSHRTISY